MSQRPARKRGILLRAVRGCLAWFVCRGATIQTVERHVNRQTVSLAILSLVAISLLACLPTPAHADDSTIGFYSGDFAVFGGVSYYPGQSTAGTYMDYNNQALNFQFLFDGNVTNFQETAYCGLGCPQFYSANIDSGTVQFSGYDASGQNPSYDFTGIIEAGGTLNGEIVCDNQGCAWQNAIAIDFQSTSGTNGWQSSGSLSYMDGNDGSGGGGFGDLTLLTQQATTPEPTSFVLLGSAFLGVGGFLRRRGLL